VAFFDLARPTCAQRPESVAPLDRDGRHGRPRVDLATLRYGVASLPGREPATYRAGAMTYDLRRLRLHGGAVLATPAGPFEPLDKVASQFMAAAFFRSVTQRDQVGLA
jgi:hypothetical protein